MEQYLKDEKDLDHLKRSTVAELAEPNRTSSTSSKQSHHSLSIAPYSFSWVRSTGNFCYWKRSPLPPDTVIPPLKNCMRNISDSPSQRKRPETRARLEPGQSTLTGPRITLSEASRQGLEDIEHHICAFCLREDPRNFTDAPELVDWIGWGKCHVWVHTACDYVEDYTNYICCMCRVNTLHYWL